MMETPTLTHRGESLEIIFLPPPQFTPSLRGGRRGAEKIFGPPGRPGGRRLGDIWISPWDPSSAYTCISKKGTPIINILGTQGHVPPRGGCSRNIFAEPPSP